MNRVTGILSAGTSFVTTSCVAILCGALLFVAAGAPAQAQSDAVRALYASSAIVSTNVEGIKTFPSPPARFNAIAASDEALAMYGFPPRPDRNARGYVPWMHAMAHARNRASDALKLHPEAVLGPMKLARKQPAQNATAGSAVPSNFGSVNWSGVANTNALTKWNKITSFDAVSSEFNVPVVDQTFGTCNSIEWEVTWNGIDGAKDGTVLQGGSSSQTFCSSNVVSTQYYAWVEWYPSYPIVEVFGINPGDDIFVQTSTMSGGCNPGFVYIEDETTLTYGTYQLNWLNGPCLVGNSAEIIVERPYGDNNVSGWYPLANYIWDFALSWSFDVKGTEFAPGATTPSTYLFTMLDDAEDQNISIPHVEGKYSIIVSDTGCAYTGGCTP